MEISRSPFPTTPENSQLTSLGDPPDPIMHSRLPLFPQAHSSLSILIHSMPIILSNGRSTFICILTQNCIRILFLYHRRRQSKQQQHLRKPPRVTYIISFLLRLFNPILSLSGCTEAPRKPHPPLHPLPSLPVVLTLSSRPLHHISMHMQLLYQGISSLSYGMQRSNSPSRILHPRVWKSTRLVGNTSQEDTMLGNFNLSMFMDGRSSRTK